MKKNVNLKNIIIMLIICVLIFINILVYIKYIQGTTKSDDNQVSKQVNLIENKSTNTTLQEDVETQLEDMTERERMEYYFSEFMEYIESEKYQEAYNLLYPEFKDTYFKTLDDFKKYVNKTYPDFVSFSYNNIERQGEIYVLTITVINPDVNKAEAKKSQRIVIKENDFNDFVLSFQVI